MNTIEIIERSVDGQGNIYYTELEMNHIIERYILLKTGQIIKMILTNQYHPRQLSGLPTKLMHDFDKSLIWLTKNKHLL